MPPFSSVAPGGTGCMPHLKLVFWRWDSWLLGGCPTVWILPIKASGDWFLQKWVALVQVLYDRPSASLVEAEPWQGCCCVGGEVLSSRWREKPLWACVWGATTAHTDGALLSFQTSTCPCRLQREESGCLWACAWFLLKTEFSKQGHLVQLALSSSTRCCPCVCGFFFKTWQCLYFISSWGQYHWLSSPALADFPPRPWVMQLAVFTLCEERAGGHPSTCVRLPLCCLHSTVMALALVTVGRCSVFTVFAEISGFLQL